MKDVSWRNLRMPLDWELNHSAMEVAMKRTAGSISLVFIYAVLAFCAQNEILTGTGTVRGRITNAENQPLSNASVRLIKIYTYGVYYPKQTRTVISDSTGAYAFSNVAEGDYKIEVQPANPSQLTPWSILDALPLALLSRTQRYVPMAGQLGLMPMVNSC